jgi:hypothetical protein
MDVGGEERRTVGRFLREATVRLRYRNLVLPAVLMLVILSLSNVVLLSNMPSKGELPSATAIVAILLRLGGLAFIGVALLRVMTQSSRPPWRLDRAFLVYLLATLVSLGLGSVLGNALGGSREPLPLLMRGIVNTVLFAPFAPWMVGMAVASPLGLNPRRFMRQFRLWLVPLLCWSLLIVTPLAWVHAIIDFRLIEGVGDLFWPLALADGALSLAIVLLGFAFNATAYDRAIADHR